MRWSAISTRSPRQSRRRAAPAAAREVAQVPRHREAADRSAARSASAARRPTRPRVPRSRHRRRARHQRGRCAGEARAARRAGAATRGRRARRWRGRRAALASDAATRAGDDARSVCRGRRRRATAAASRPASRRRSSQRRWPRSPACASRAALLSRRRAAPALAGERGGRDRFGASEGAASEARRRAARASPCGIVTGAGTGTWELERDSGSGTNSSRARTSSWTPTTRATRCDRRARFEHALFVLASVMSMPAPGRAVCDAGLKALAFDSGLPLRARGATASSTPRLPTSMACLTSPRRRSRRRSASGSG